MDIVLAEFSVSFDDLEVSEMVQQSVIQSISNEILNSDFEESFDGEVEEQLYDVFGGSAFLYDIIKDAFGEEYVDLALGNIDFREILGQAFGIYTNEEQWKVFQDIEEDSMEMLMNSAFSAYFQYRLNEKLVFENLPITFKVSFRVESGSKHIKEGVVGLYIEDLHKTLVISKWVLIANSCLSFTANYYGGVVPLMADLNKVAETAVEYAIDQTAEIAPVIDDAFMFISGENQKQKETYSRWLNDELGIIYEEGDSHYVAPNNDNEDMQEIKILDI